MTQPTKPEPLPDPISLEEDPGLISVTLIGKKFKVSPMEELRKMRKMAEPGLSGIPNDSAHSGERGEVYLLAVRDYIKKQYGLEVSPDFAGAYHRKLEAANETLLDFFGLRLNLPLLSALTPADSAAELSGDGSACLSDSEPSSPSETLLTDTLNSETNTASD
jgi:hypothetical protein